MKNQTADKETKKMTEAELAGKLRGLQILQSLCILAAFICGLGCVIVLLFTRSALTAALLFCAAAACIAGGSALRGRKKKLIREQLAGFFRSELESAFGLDRRTPEMSIDRELMERLGLSCGEWEECGVENLYEGTHGGITFSAANVLLEHVYVVRQAHEGANTCRKTVFGGIVFRCKTDRTPSAPIRVVMRTDGSPCGILTGNAAFDGRFCVTADQNAVSLINPLFAEAFEPLLQSVRGQVIGMYWEDGVFTAVLETRYGFAVVSDDADQGNLEAVRRSYRDSLREMGRLTDLVMKNPVLFPGRD